MSTKATVRYQKREGELPAWHLYREAFERDKVVYLEIEGVQTDITMIDEATPATVLLRLPEATARQMGLLVETPKSDTSSEGPQ